MKRTVLTLSFFVVCAIKVFPQTYNQPNVALKSPETLEISKIEINSKATTVFLSVENRITGGYFCADKNIFIIYPDGTRSRLTSSKGIPVCPDKYKFKVIGEKLNFELTFPPLKQDVTWVDLAENCSDNCISLFGICLDNDLNKKIDDASALAEKGNLADALMDFIKIAGPIDNKNSGIMGLIYMDIIKLSKETANTAKAAEWYSKLKLSGIPRIDLYIKYLNSQGIIY